MPKFELPIKYKFHKHPTQEPAYITSANEGNVSSEDIKRVAEICSEPLIYETLFKELTNNKPYTKENAESFIKMAYDGWEKNEKFIFLIKNTENQVIGACDIKSNNIDSAEIGYWMSETEPGYMTNAVKALTQIAKEAGFKELYGLAKPNNEKSQKVLVRASFINVGQTTVKNKLYEKFVMKL